MRDQIHPLQINFSKAGTMKWLSLRLSEENPREWLGPFPELRSQHADHHPSAFPRYS